MPVHTLTHCQFVQLSEVFYILTTTLLKVSLGLFFLRVLTKKWQKHVFHVILGVGVFYGLFYFFIALFQCGDPAHIADTFVAQGARQCLPKKLSLTAGYIYGIINILADWTFVLIPITVLMDSDLDRGSKISVGVVMGLGAVGSISSIMRLVYLDGLSLNAIGALSGTTSVWTLHSCRNTLTSKQKRQSKQPFGRLPSPVRESLLHLLLSYVLLSARSLPK